MNNNPSIEIESHGQGEPLLMLHSLLCDKHGFDHVRQELASRYRLIMPSMPGYGKSSYLDADVSEVADILVESLKEMDVHRFKLLGNGYGGFVALAIAQQHPQAVDRLILLDSASYFPPQGKEAIRKMKELLESSGMEAVAPIALDRLFPDEFKAENPNVVSHYRKALLGFDTRTFVRTCQNLIDVDLRPGLGKVEAPTLVAVGLKDAATPPALARFVADNIPGSRYLEIEGCGHVPHVQMPARTARIIIDFLGRQSE